MANPFEDTNRNYVVIINDEGQHSLWPTWINVPNGWEITYGPGTRETCLSFVDKNWTDMRPKTLIIAMNEARTKHTTASD